jgi:hydrogenase maturation protein HypF
MLDGLAERESWSATMDRMIRRRLVITGIVQGVGFRPFVWRRATRLGLAGFVENTPAGVVVEIEGPAEAVASFSDGLAAAAPPLATVERITAVDITTVDITAVDIPAAADAQAGPFRILASVGGGRPEAVVPPDIATCEACLAEMRDPANRRHGHPFITCTDCGPRATIIERLPYDRPATTMARFPMCPACAAEYADPADRRFHAQPIACPDCGPVVWFAAASADARDPIPTTRPAAPPEPAAAIAAARQLLGGGGILAVKNLGGFHLACDATSAAAVARLRERKRRPAKPLAVMAASLAAARQLALIDDQQARLLTGPERPIVLVRKRAGSGLADTIAPGTEFLGIMLPAAPLQHLLAEGLPSLVMTSGNLADEPIATGNAEAVARLAGIADGFLMHDREIHVPCDDSVVRCVAGAALPIRRSRGHTPLPIRLAASGPPVLAVGGDLKAVLCLAVGEQAIMSQHLGDVGSLETLAAIERAAEHLLAVFGVEPAAVAADLHPGSISARWAERFARARGIPLVRVQHHEAHAAALLAEHFGDAVPPAVTPCLVACFDGTGYWPDASIAGGEFFVADASGIRRVAHLAPFPLPGGDAAVRHPWRTALAVLHAAGIPWDDRLPAVRAAGEAARRLLRQQLARGLACPPTTSMGRLFDAVAALAGGPPSISFEAEAALWLESEAAAGSPADDRYTFGLSPAAADTPLVVDWRPVVAALVGDLLAGRPVEELAASFHHAVARMIDAVSERLGSAASLGLSGGVFQNALLVERTLARCRRRSRGLLLHHSVPPSDGGLALGQAVLARHRGDQPNGSAGGSMPPVKR